jgi:hypothetical protein
MKFRRNYCTRWLLHEITLAEKEERSNLQHVRDCYAWSKKTRATNNPRYRRQSIAYDIHQSERRHHHVEIIEGLNESEK